jgi:hypothetical protein
MSGRDETPEKQHEFGESTRRTFISRLGMASLVATAGSITPAFAERSVKPPAVTRIEGCYACHADG